MAIDISGLPTPRNNGERLILENIAAHGLHIYSVSNRVDDPDPGPSFSYSVGLWHSTRQPEVIILGLNSDLAAWILNEIYRRRVSGSVFECGLFYSNFLDGHSVSFLVVDRSEYQRFVLGDIWLYGGSDFPLLQLVYPTTSGVFPFDHSASQEFKDIQPLLGVWRPGPAK